MNRTASSEVPARVARRLGVAENAFSRLSVCTFPQAVVSAPPYALWRIFTALGILPRAYSPWEQYDLCVCFEDHTTAVIDVPSYLDESSKLWIVDEVTGESRHERSQVRRFINAGCRDISKRFVGRVFEDVFGYPLDVDPRKHVGKMVRKSNSNASHDGSIVIGPISPADFESDAEDFVYSVAVNNIDGDMSTDLRLLWSGHLSSMLYRKQRPVRARFSRGARAAHLEPVVSHLTEDEIDSVGRFCSALGLDYGELDSLRDNDTGRLYIVDANKTPCSHLMGLSDEEATEAVVCLATDFAEGFLMDL